MTSTSCSPASLKKITVSAACISLLLAVAASTRADRPKKLLQLDPDAVFVDLFDGMEDGTLEAKLVPKDSLGGKIFITNLTDKPLTVQLPKSFVGVHVLKQFGGGGFGGGGLGGAGGGGFGGGGGLYSIPPEEVAKIPYQSVCLEHGKTEPRPSFDYRIVKVEEYTNNPTLQELLLFVGTRRVNLGAAQAAAWHLNSEMSWQELAAKRYTYVSRPPQPYFSPQHLRGAQNLVALAAAQAREKSEGEQGADSERDGDRTPRRTGHRRFHSR